jgi:glycosyltransferase involved in cell wall biosynthesis
MTSIVSANQNPLISIVVPTFNRASTVGYCLNSIFNQTYENIEIIVVDDCSTDKTIEVVKGYHDPRIRCIALEKNLGAQAARNTGIKEATGDWIAFQDSDDEWLPDKLERQVAVLSKIAFNPFTVIHSNAITFSYKYNVKRIWHLPVIEGKNDNVYPLLLANPGPMFQSLLVSKSVLERINYLDENVPSYQEWDTSILLAKYCRFIHIQEPLFVYHLHNEDTISKDMKGDFLGYKYIIEKHEGDIKTYCGEKIWNQHLLSLLRKCLELGLMEEFESLIEKHLITDKLIKKAYIKEISHCLDNERWREADLYFSKIAKSNSFKLTLLKLCRALYLKPGISRYKTILTTCRSLIRPDKT